METCVFLLKYILGQRLMGCMRQALPAQQEVIESDSLITVKTVNSTVTNLLEVGNIIYSWRAELGERSNISVLFFRKQVNKAAQLMASVACLFNSYNVFRSPPHLLFWTILYDFVFYLLKFCIL